MRTTPRLPIVFIIACVCLPASACSPLRVPAAPTPAETSPAAPDDTLFQSVARAVIDRANTTRAEAGLRPLRESEPLMRAAQEYARELAVRQRLSHDSPRPGRETVTRRIEAAGGSWQRAGENLAATSDTRVEVPGRTIALWLDSPGHRRNLLDAAWVTTGAGVARNTLGHWYVVQIYVVPPPQRLRR